MIIHDFHLIRVGVAPFETNPPLVVDANAVLSVPVAGQFFQMIRGRRPQIVQRDRVVQHTQFAQRDLLNGWRQFA